MYEQIIGLIAVAGTIAGYFAGRRKSKAEADNSELDATKKAIEIWRELATEYKGRLDELTEENERLRNG